MPAVYTDILFLYMILIAEMSLSLVIAFFSLACSEICSNQNLLETVIVGLLIVIDNLSIYCQLSPLTAFHQGKAPAQPLQGCSVSDSLECHVSLYQCASSLPH